jgi:hypothetical protein
MLSRRRSGAVVVKLDIGEENPQVDAEMLEFPIDAAVSNKFLINDTEVYHIRKLRTLSIPVLLTSNEPAITEERSPKIGKRPRPQFVFFGVSHDTQDVKSLAAQMQTIRG